MVRKAAPGGRPPHPSRPPGLPAAEATASICPGGRAVRLGTGMWCPDTSPHMASAGLTWTWPRTPPTTPRVHGRPAGAQGAGPPLPVMTGPARPAPHPTPRGLGCPQVGPHDLKPGARGVWCCVELPGFQEDWAWSHGHGSQPVPPTLSPGRPQRDAVTSHKGTG